MTHTPRSESLVAARNASLLALSAALFVGGCATTGRDGVSTTAGMRMASAEDCAVVSMTLELFPRPADGSMLKVSDVALPVQPSFRPQRAEQRGFEPLSLGGCRAIRTEFVSSGAQVVLGRPEIHDASVFVRYREGENSPVFAELERTADGHWRHIGAYPVAPLRPENLSAHQGFYVREPATAQTQGLGG